MRNWVLLLGLAIVLTALVMAGGQTVLSEPAAHANQTLAGGVFSIPLAAVIRL